MKSYLFAKCYKNFVNLLPFLPTIKLTCGPKDTSRRLWHMKFLRQIFSIIPMSASFYNKMLQEKLLLSLIFLYYQKLIFLISFVSARSLILSGLLIMTHTELMSKSALCVRFISSSSSSSVTLLLVPAWLVVFFRLGPASSSPLRFDIAVFCSLNYTFMYAAHISYSCSSPPIELWIAVNK